MPGFPMLGSLNGTLTIYWMQLIVRHGKASQQQRIFPRLSPRLSASARDNVFRFWIPLAPLCVLCARPPLNFAFGFSATKMRSPIDIDDGPGCIWFKLLSGLERHTQ